jgi:hypothetical protein
MEKSVKLLEIELNNKATSDQLDQSDHDIEMVVDGAVGSGSETEPKINPIIYTVRRL